MLNDSKRIEASKHGKDSESSVIDHTRELEKLTPSMILYGSRGFVQAWNNFRTISRTSPIKDNDDQNEKRRKMYRMFASMEAMLLAARKDLGHRVSDVDTSEYVATFINDLDREELKKVHKTISSKTTN